MRTLLLRLRFAVKARLLKLLYFKNEQAVLRGRLQGETKENSVIFFTVHKAGSSLLSMRLTPFFRKHGFATADLSSYFAKTDPAQREKFFGDAAWKKKVFACRGVYYCVFRYPFEVPQLDEHRIILVLRDPRDVLVSHYFSTRFSHPTLNMDFYSLKQKAGHMDVDEYVQYIAPDFQQRYETYLSLIGRPNVLFLRYEDMISAPEAFEERLRNFLALPMEKGEIVSAEDFKLEKEDPYAHKRYVQSGDHVRKLKQETIAALNEKFGKVLDVLGYRE